MNINVYEDRIKRLRDGLITRGLQASFITKQQNYRYMSGFTGTSAFLLITGDKAFLITDFRYIEQAERQAPSYEVVRYHGSFIVTVKELLEKCNIRSVGFEENEVSYKTFIELKEKLDSTELLPLNSLIEELRIIKDSSELEAIKKAVEIADNAFEDVIKCIKPGISELEVAAEIEYSMKKNGASGASFETIVASGLRSSMPHGVASEKKIQHGEVITMDYGALYNGYCSDITRTIFLGEPSPELKKIYNIVLEAQLEALKKAHKGLSGKEIDLVARNVIAEAGYGENFGHGLGHGVGLEIHEEPRFSPTGDKIMENGMVVTVEPGIYVSGIGGVRIEDMIIINDTNPINLTKAKKGIIVIE